MVAQALALVAYAWIGWYLTHRTETMRGAAARKLGLAKIPSREG